MVLLHEEKIRGDKDRFKAKLVEISQKLDFNPNWLMAVMNKESGLNPQARNTTYLVSGKPATGLIQWVENTAQGKFGLSVDDIYQMDSVEQLDLVYKYFQNDAHRINKYSDVYRYTFFPVSLGKPDDYVFKTSSLSASSVASSNPVIDLNKDSQITNTEFDEYALKGIPEPWRTEFLNENRDNWYKFSKRNYKQIGAGVLMIAVALGLIYYMKFKK